MELDERQKRIRELAQISQKRNIYTFTDFLPPSYLIQVAQLCDGTKWEEWGGSDFCERKMVKFGSEIGYDADYPLCIIKVTSSSSAFVSPFTHRDLLGSLLALGIDRGKVGDVFACEHEGYIVIHEDLKNFVLQSLNRVGRSSVKLRECNEIPDTYAPKFDESVIIVSSLRSDVVISRAYNLSREDALELFLAGSVSINGRCKERNADLIKDGDVIAVRGKGKFVFEKIVGTTQKDKIRVLIKKYK